MQCSACFEGIKQWTPVTRGKALVDLAFTLGLHVSNRPILLRRGLYVLLLEGPRRRPNALVECRLDTSLSSHYSLLRLFVSLIPGGRDTGNRPNNVRP